MAKIFWGVAKSFALLVVLLIAHLVEYSEAVTNPGDTSVLQAFYERLEDPDGHLRNWRDNTDPCDDGWVGVFCCTSTTSNITYVQELRLFGFNLGGTLAPELGNLSELGYLDVMWNRLTGNIPSTLGNLSELEILCLNGNYLTGTLPPELGNLGELERLQIDENMISGPIPSEFGMLESVLHLHLNNNSLNGSLPKELGDLPHVIHILADNNNLTGYLPSEIADAPQLLIIQLDNNQFASDAEIPPSWMNISTLLKLSLRNCGLTGSIPDLVHVPQLNVLDLSHNMLTGIIPNTSEFPVNLTYLDLSYNQLSGHIPTSIGNLQSLEYLALKNNTLSGGIPQNLGSGQAFQSSQDPRVIDLQNNQLTMSSSEGNYLATLVDTTETKIYLGGNPNISACSGADSQSNPLCIDPHDDDSLDYLFPFDSPQKLAPDNYCSSCEAITIGLRLKSPLIVSFDEYTPQFVDWFATGMTLNPMQVAVTNYTWMQGPRLNVTILVYPSHNTTTFQESEFDNIYSNISQWNLNDSSTFGPWEFLGFSPQSLAGFASLSHGLLKGAIAGIVIGVTVFGMVITGLVMFAVYWHHRPSAAVRAQIKRLYAVKRNPALKVAGVIAFTYEDLSRATNNFDEKNLIGQGGYGKVYVGDVKEVNHRVAIKRAEVGSTQGANEFYTEIELLSRIHHRNLCGLVGYCDDIGEQMLVYEFMPGGTLQNHLFEFTGMPLNFPARLRIALGSARGILYLHTEANPPIFHRDIKASNILLDGHMVAKVADFGLSRLAPVPNIDGGTPGHVSTLLKGTPGYMDPEYFLTHKLTNKSDVFSFGVVLLELITGMPAISKGKNIVREAHARYEAGEILSMVDPHIVYYSTNVLKEFMQLAVSCSSNSPDERPTMSEVVHTLEKLSRHYTHSFSDVPSIEMTSSTTPTTPTTSSDNSTTVPFLPSIYPYSSREILSTETSQLFSGTVMHVTPR